MFAQIVIERAFDWTPVIAALAALGGALIGALAIFILELWRRALDSQTAARVLRIETIDNRNKVDALLGGKSVRSPLETDAWKEMKFSVAPLLEELQLFRIAESYAEMRDFAIVKISPAAFSLAPIDRDWVGDWLKKMTKQAKWLHDLEASSPWVLALKLMLRRRVATPEEIRNEYGISEDEFKEFQAKRGLGTNSD